MVEDPNKAGAIVPPDPSQDPNAAGKSGAAPTSGAGDPGAAGSQPDPNDNNKTVPITALHEERDKRQALQAQMEALKSALGNHVQYDQFGNPLPASPQPQAVNPQAQQLDTLWETDPRKAMQAELSMAMNWYDGVNIAVDGQESDAMKKFPDYMNYRPDIKAYLNRLPIAQRSKPGVVDLAYYAVRGQNVDTITEKAQKQLLERIRSGEKIQGLGQGTVTTSSQPKPTQLTSDQKTAASALGMSEADYLKHMK